MTTPVTYERCLAAAEEHGLLSEVEMEVGDLRDYFRVAYNLLTPEQKQKFAEDATVLLNLEIGEDG